MTQKPERHANEKLASYMLRLLDWESIHRTECMAQFRSIDSAMKRAPISNQPAITRQTEYDRQTLHDRAQNNPAIKRMLRRMQLTGTTV